MLSVDGTPDKNLDLAEQKEIVRETVAGMPDNRRPILIMAYFTQLPYKEMAEILNVSLGTVKSRLHAAVKPGLNNARAISNHVACAANLQSAKMAFGNYAANHEDAMPFVACQSDESWWLVGDIGEVNISNTRSFYLLVKEDL